MKLLNINVNGNKKLKNNENVRFMIWNLPACKTCPFKTAHCEKFCYARKAERVYKNVLPCRENNYTESLNIDFVEKMTDTIKYYLNKKSFKNKKVVFRIHESGDFYSKEYTEKWVDIANHFRNDHRIVFTAYTKSLPFFIDCGYGSDSFPENFIVRSSLWDDTSITMQVITLNYHFPVYTALSADDMEKERKKGHEFFKCECKDCGTCLECYRNTEKDIIVEIH